MKKISLQWKLTLLTTVLITILCGCLTFFLYKNGVYYFDTLQESITDQGTEPESVYIDIPDNEWDDFVSQFSMKVYNSKSDYRSRSLLITAIVALFGGAATYFISGRALKPLRKFSETVEKVQAQNLKDYTIEENKIAELEIRPSQIPAHSMEISDAMNEILSKNDKIANKPTGQEPANIRHIGTALGTMTHHDGKPTTVRIIVVTAEIKK